MIEERVRGAYDFIKEHASKAALGFLVIPASILALEVLDQQINIEQETLRAWQQTTEMIDRVDKVEAAGSEKDSIAQEGVIFDAEAEVQTQGQVSKEKVYFPADMLNPQELAIVIQKGINPDFIPVDVGLELLNKRSKTLTAQATYKPGGYGPPPTLTSAYEAGSVAVTVVRVESTGPESEYDWTAEDKALVESEFAEMTASVEKDAPPDARLKFTPIQVRDVEVSVEPTSHPHDETAWLEEAFTKLGYPTGFLSTRGRLLSNDARQAQGADWGRVYFIPLGEQFTDGVSGYTFLWGGYVVIPLDGDGWGRHNLDAVAGHEEMHTGAGVLDQYPPFGCDMKGGYLSVWNGNAQTQQGSHCGTNERSRMRSWILDRYLDSIYGRGQAGWRYSTNKPIIDVLNTTPEIFWRGGNLFEIQDIPWPSSWITSVTINRVTDAWRYNGGIWQPLVPKDGDFGGYTEEVEVSLDGLCNVIKAENTVGNWGAKAFDAGGNPIAPETLTIDPPSLVVEKGSYCCLEAYSFACGGVEIGPPSVTWSISPGGEINEYGRISVVRSPITQTLIVTGTESSGLKANAEIIVPPLQRVYLPIIIR